MSRLIAHANNLPEMTACALFPARTALSWMTNKPCDTVSFGWGLGFIQGEEVLLQKNPRARSGEIDFYNLACKLRSDALIGRISDSSTVTSAAENTDPFRFRAWLFGMTGEVSDFEPVRERMLQSIPDFLRRNIHGRSASEHIFHLFLAFLHDAGLLETRSPDPMVVQQALHQSARFFDKLLGRTPEVGAGRTLIATNGRALVVECQRLPTQFLALDGISDCTCPACPARRDAGEKVRRVSHPELRTVVIESDTGLRERLGWTRLPETSALVVGLDRIPRIVTGDASFA